MRTRHKRRELINTPRTHLQEASAISFQQAGGEPTSIPKPHTTEASSRKRYTTQPRYTLGSKTNRGAPPPGPQEHSPLLEHTQPVSRVVAEVLRHEEHDQRPYHPQSQGHVPVHDVRRADAHQAHRIAQVPAPRAAASPAKSSQCRRGSMGPGSTNTHPRGHSFDEVCVCQNGDMVSGGGRHRDRRRQSNGVDGRSAPSLPSPLTPARKRLALWELPRSRRKRSGEHTSGGTNSTRYLDTFQRLHQQQLQTNKQK